MCIACLSIDGECKGTRIHIQNDEEKNIDVDESSCSSGEYSFEDCPNDWTFIKKRTRDNVDRSSCVDHSDEPAKYQACLFEKLSEEAAMRMIQDDMLIMEESMRINVINEQAVVKASDYEYNIRLFQDTSSIIYHLFKVMESLYYNVPTLLDPKYQRFSNFVICFIFKKYYKSVDGEYDVENENNLITAIRKLEPYLVKDSTVVIAHYPQFRGHILDDKFLQKCDQAIDSIMSFISMCTTCDGEVNTEGYKLNCTKLFFDSVVKVYLNKAIEALNFFH
jgi:hypothetical protein